MYENTHLASIHLSYIYCPTVLRVGDIMECIQGVHYDTVRSTGAPKDDSCYLTIAVQSPSNNPRYVALMLENRDERNSLVTGLRYAMREGGIV